MRFAEGRDEAGILEDSRLEDGTAEGKTAEDDGGQDGIAEVDTPGDEILEDGIAEENTAEEESVLQKFLSFENSFRARIASHCIPDVAIASPHKTVAHLDTALLV